MRRTIDRTPNYILHNGNIHTVDSQDRCFKAVATAGNTISALGGDEHILKLRGPNTNLVDLRGRSVIPGIIDSHNHAWEAGQLMAGLVTFGIPSIEQLQDEIASEAAGLAPGQWLHGGGWIETQFAENRMPTRHDLDEAAPDNPVVLERIFSTCVANSRALQLAGIDADTPDPEGGEIERDPQTGEPTGVLHRAAKMILRRCMPGPFGADRLDPTAKAAESITRAADEYLRWGITSIVEPGVTPAISRCYQQMYREDRLPLRVCLMPNWHGFELEQDENFLQRVVTEGAFVTGFGDEWLRLGGLKMAIDGGLTSRTALLSWPYQGKQHPPDPQLRLPPDRLSGWVRQAHDMGWSVGIHVVGDVSQDQAVRAIWRAQRENPRSHRHQIIHGYYPTESALQMMSEAEIVASVQPSFIYGEADGYPGLLPEEKQVEFLPLKSYLQAGITVAISSDMPSAHFNPFWGMYAAVTRRGMRGYQLGERECIGVEEALRMMTINGAYLTGEQQQKGSIEVGKLADMAVLSEDLSEISPDELRNLGVDMTMLDGQAVHTK